MTAPAPMFLLFCSMLSIRQDTSIYLARHGGFRVVSFETWLLSVSESCFEDLYGHGLSNAPPVAQWPQWNPSC